MDIHVFGTVARALQTFRSRGVTGRRQDHLMLGGRTVRVDVADRPAPHRLADQIAGQSSLERLRELGETNPQVAQLRRLQNLAGGHARRSLHQIRVDQNSQPFAPLAEVLLGSTRSPTAWLQMKKDEKQRGDKFRRKAHAAETINELKDKVKPSLQGHIFDALPTGGGQIDPSNPTGLHAYATDGALPGNVIRVGTRGARTRIHELTWRFTGVNTPIKTSTMFPDWMGKDHVNTLIALAYRNDPQICAAGIDDTKIHKIGTEEYIKRGLSIRLHKAGNTVYPLME